MSSPKNAGISPVEIVCSPMHFFLAMRLILVYSRPQLNIIIYQREEVGVMTSSAAGKKQYIIYNEYWPDLVKEKDKQRITKGEWMKRSGLFWGRFSEFDNKYRGKEGKDVTAYYMLRLLTGLGLKWEDFVRKVEAATGKRMTEEQREALGLRAWEEAHEEELKMCQSDPEGFRLAMELLKGRKR
jgi:hypothetical protein